MQNQQGFQQTYQNVGNFSSPIMQPQNQPQQFGPMHQQQQLYNNQFPEQFIPQHQIDYNNQGIPPQQQMYPQQNPYQQQPMNNNLGPMFVNAGQPHIINQQVIGTITVFLLGGFVPFLMVLLKFKSIVYIVIILLLLQSLRRLAHQFNLLIGIIQIRVWKWVFNKNHFNLNSPCR